MLFILRPVLPFTRSVRRTYLLCENTYELSDRVWMGTCPGDDVFAGTHLISGSVPCRVERQNSEGTRAIVRVRIFVMPKNVPTSPLTTVERDP